MTSKLGTSWALAFLLAACGAEVNTDDTTACTLVDCALDCPFGFVEDADGCQTCECIPGTECTDVLCNLFCPGGFQVDEYGCEICACAPDDCEGPNPAGCVVNACPPDQVCDTSVGCTSSSCVCEGGAWSCDDDCGGGTCVPVTTGCEGPNPAGCVQTGCAMGEVCDTNLGCMPSGCACDESNGSWGCTADCGGGVCVPDPSGCDAPYPGGCMQTGCPLDQVCAMTSGVCVPSSCVCDGNDWLCTDDCGGGICAGP